MQVNKDNIEIIFFEDRSDWKVVLKGKSEQASIHKQYAITIMTPPYKDQYIDSNVEVIFFLF